MTDEEYLAHIESAILEIMAHTAGMSQEAYEADSKTQRAVERNLQIVGDAAHKLSAKLKEANSDVPWDDGLRRKERGGPPLLRCQPEDPLGHPAGRPRPAPEEGPGGPRFVTTCHRAPRWR